METNMDNKVEATVLSCVIERPRTHFISKEVIQSSFWGTQQKGRVSWETPHIPYKTLKPEVPKALSPEPLEP